CPGAIGERASRTVVRVLPDLERIEHGSKTNVGSLEFFTPCLPRLRAKGGGDCLPQRGPFAPVPLGLKAQALKLKARQQFGIELRLDRTYRNPLAVGGF